MIPEMLKETATEQAGQLTVTDVRIGLSYTAVLLDNGSVGVTMTFRNLLSDGCIVSDSPLIGKKAAHLIDGVDSPELLERTVALATVNAVVNRQKPGIIGGDNLDNLSLTGEDVVGMVGFFGPLVPGIRSQVKTLTIFEKLTDKAPGLYPEEAAFEMLPACTVAIITSTSLVNLTLEKLLSAAVNCRKVVLTGASTPLLPEVFKPYGVDMLSGIIGSNPSALLRVISEGGGMRSFKGHIRKVNMHCH
ncbi:MAG: DUF364 domain-containing protein [bacterium]